MKASSSDDECWFDCSEDAYQFSEECSSEATSVAAIHPCNLSDRLGVDEYRVKNNSMRYPLHRCVNMVIESSICTAKRVHAVSMLLYTLVHSNSTILFVHHRAAFDNDVLALQALIKVARQDGTLTSFDHHGNTVRTTP